MPSEKQPRPAECVDLDDDGKKVPGTRVKASTSASRPKMPHLRTSSSSKPKKPYDNTPPPSPHHTRSGSSAKVSSRNKVEVVDDKARKDDRRRSGSERTNGSSKRSSSRPPSSYPKLLIPSQKDDPTHYGVPPQSAPVKSIPMRPRATTSQSYNGRPLSYNGTPYSAAYGAGPPLSSSAYYNTPSPLSAVPFGTSFPPTPTFRHATQQDYFAPLPARTLKDRFVDPILRTMSAHGMRDPPLRQKAIDDSPYDDGYMSAAEGSSLRNRRASIREPSRPTFSKEEVDRASMPPPPRPMLRKVVTTSDYVRDPSPAPEQAALQYTNARPQYYDESLRRKLNRNSVSYDLNRDNTEYRIETANNGRRRRSYYDQSVATGSSGAGYEDKLKIAKGYQQDVGGGDPVPLTAELLKKQQRRQAGSSRSTKSSRSRSREESEYRRSATTRTTRSGSGADDENVTIKVLGSAKILFGGAHLELGKDGGEVQIKRQSSIRNGSEKSNSEYSGHSGQRRIDDRQSRTETSRPPAIRRSSQSYERKRADHFASSQGQHYQGNWV